MRNIVLLALVAGSLTLTLGCVPPEVMQRDAEIEGHAWATQMGMPEANVICAGADSEPDGYVSCTVREPSGKMNTIECRYQQPLQFFEQKGCKLSPFANINSQ